MLFNSEVELYTCSIYNKKVYAFERAVLQLKTSIGIASEVIGLSSPVLYFSNTFTDNLMDSLVKFVSIIIDPDVESRDIPFLE